MLKNDGLQLWLDRYYIAFSRYQETAIHYVSRYHINEERSLYKRRKMPKEIKKAFNYAEKQMDKHKLDYYVSKKFLINFLNFELNKKN